MRIVLIDDELNAINELKYYLIERLNESNIEIINTYLNPFHAIDNIVLDKPDLIFIDFNMPEISGLEVAKKYQEIFPNIMIIFVTAHEKYALESFQVHPQDYLLKPIRVELLEKTMKHINNQYIIRNQSTQKETYGVNIRVKCFGKFEVINDKGIAMKFTTKKAKELFSYILCSIDKPIYRNEVLDLFYGEMDHTKALNNYYVTLYRLRNAITNFGFQKDEIEIKENCDIYIKDGICDFVDFIRIFRKNQSMDESSLMKYRYLIRSYNGELFGGIDKEWVDDMREWVDIQMEELMLRTSNYLILKKEYQEAQDVLEKLIKINPYTVLGYEALLELFLTLNKKESFQLLYKKYINVMKLELGLEDEFVKDFGKRILL